MASLYTQLVFFASSLFRLNLPAGVPVCMLVATLHPVHIHLPYRLNTTGELG